MHPIVRPKMAIRCTDDKSCVVRTLPVAYDTQDRFRDYRGRTKKDLEFLEQFEKIFNAAVKGDVQKCQTIINLGFCDVNARFYGKCRSGHYDGISPLQIAHGKRDTKMIDLLQKTLNKIQ